METSTRTSRSQETDTSNDFDSLYYELEKRILTLISDDEKEDFGESMIVKQSNPMWINRPRPILEQQNESYFCWNRDYETSTTLAPVWLLNLWSKTRNGTGVFIPVAMRTRYRNIPNRLQAKTRKLAEKTSD